MSSVPLLDISYLFCLQVKWVEMRNVPSYFQSAAPLDKPAVWDEALAKKTRSFFSEDVNHDKTMKAKAT